MKTNLRKALSMVLVLSILLAISSIGVLASEVEPLPSSLSAPSDIVLYDYGSYNTSLVVKVKTPQSVLDVYEKGHTNRTTSSNGYGYVSDYGNYFLYESAIQIDWKIDDGDWQYTSEWDTSYYISSYMYDSFSGERVIETGLGSSSSYYHSGIAEKLNELGCLTTTTDGSSTYYRMDIENHKVTARARYYFSFYDENYNKTIILSDWSDTAVYGDGSTPTSSAPMSLSAPELRNLEIYRTDSYEGYPEARFDLYVSGDIEDALMWVEQYDADLDDSEIYMQVETSLDPNFGQGATVHKRTFYESSILSRKIAYDYLFYDLWYDLPTSDQEAFAWNGETVYVRARLVNERRIGGEWSEIYSPYSEVISIQGPVIKSYDITVTHGSYGFDEEAYYTESYKITEGCELDSFYCAPLEGCYVDTVTVNGELMYAYDDETTHDLLDWYSYDPAFEFYGDDDIASKDLVVEITYAGTPTASYGITTEYGNGGDLYVYDNYVSWENNSLVVYHGTEVTFYIEPDYGFVIDTVIIDGEENAQAKENGYYTFPAITDNSHNIEVTFKREAYRVYYYADYNGTITTDYEWYDGRDGYVRIGDDITFTYAPNQDGNGNYYEIESVYIDYIVNEEAKVAGTYTFTNVQASHDIYVYFSDDPVITHDITATSGENGSISPEGVVHVREGNTRRFDFIPDEGYEVDEVFVDGVEITNLATKEYYNIANVAEDHTIYVTFKKLPVQYDVNVIVSGHNTSAHSVSPQGITPVWEGESFTVTFAPFAGYEIEKIEVNGAAVQADGTYTIASVNADTVIEIFFIIKSYVVTFVDYDGTELKKETVEHGAQATAPADPTRDHYVFLGWDTTFSDITTNVTIRATYKPAEYTVKFLGWDGSTLKTETVTYGADATAPEAPAREGYDFDRWSQDFTNVSASLEITAIYTQKEYTVTFVDSDDTVISTQTVKYGEAATAPATPTKDGYTFIGWDNTNYGYVTQAMTIKAMYVEGTGVTYTVTARALGNSGSVTPIGATIVQENASLTLTFTPSELSKIIRVVVDGTDIDICNTYTFTNIAANHTIDVYFAPTAVINVSSNNTEYGTASGHYDLIDGETVYVVDATPADGYELDGVYVNDEKIEPDADGNYIITDFSEDMDIDVRFKPIDDGNGDGDGDGNGSNDGGNDNPPTGNNTNMALWIALLAISGLGVLFTVRKKEKLS